MKKHTILIIEDEKDLAELVTFNLETEGYRTIVARDGISGLETAREIQPDLILLDLMLPGIQGIEICRLLKRDTRTAGIPVIMLTAKGEEIDRVVGFEVGADDYVVKPFSIRELLLRIRAMLRRGVPEKAGRDIIRIGPVTIDTIRHRVDVNGGEVILTGTEFRLLLYMAERLGRMQSREVLLTNVWGFNYVGDTRTVDTHVTRIRTKLGKAGEMIKTIRGFGYKMEEE